MEPGNGDDSIRLRPRMRGLRMGDVLLSPDGAVLILRAGAQITYVRPFDCLLVQVASDEADEVRGWPIVDDADYSTALHSTVGTVLRSSGLAG